MRCACRSAEENWIKASNAASAYQAAVDQANKRHQQCAHTLVTANKRVTCVLCLQTHRYLSVDLPKLLDGLEQLERDRLTTMQDNLAKFVSLRQQLRVPIQVC